mgnify:CR=1 FL=1
MIKDHFRSKQLLMAAYAVECVAPMLRLAARVWTGKRSAPESWKKGLLIGANHIGDILYRTASLTQLAKGLPGCTWDILATEPSAQVLERNPAIRKIHRMEIPSCGSADFQMLKRENYDVAICYDSGAYTRPLLTTTLLGIPNRVGYVHKGLSGLVTHPISINYPQPFPAYFRDVVAQLTDQEPNWSLRPKVILTEEDLQEAAFLWSALKLPHERPVLACFVTTRQPSGSWPMEKFQETLELVHMSSPVSILLCGAPGDEARLRELQQSLSFPTEINAGRIGLRSLVALLAKCRVVLSSDSGPRHLANAAGTPVVFARNPWFSRKEAGVYCPDSECDMAPSLEFVSPESQGDYWQHVSAEAVASEIVALLHP